MPGAGRSPPALLLLFGAGGSSVRIGLLPGGFSPTPPHPTPVSRFLGSGVRLRGTGLGCDVIAGEAAPGWIRLSRRRRRAPLWFRAGHGCWYPAVACQRAGKFTVSPLLTGGRDGGTGEGRGGAPNRSPASRHLGGGEPGN